MYFHSDHLNDFFSRKGIKNWVISGKIFQCMSSPFLWSKILVIASFREASSTFLYSYTHIKKYAIWNKDRYGIKSLKPLIVQKNPTPQTHNLNEIKIFKTLLHSWKTLPAWLHIVTVSIFCEVPVIIWNRMSINLFGPGYQSYEQTLRDNRCSELLSSYFWKKRSTYELRKNFS